MLILFIMAIADISKLQVFAADIFSSKFRGNLSNQYVGMQFRNQVRA